MVRSGITPVKPYFPTDQSMMVKNHIEEYPHSMQDRVIDFTCHRVSNVFTIDSNLAAVHCN